MIDPEYEVIIVGARVAGSVLAALLGDLGYKTLLIDRATFPSPTLSTHYFRGEFTLTVLKQLGILDEMLALGSPPLKQIYYFDKDQQKPRLEPPQIRSDIGYNLSIRREPFDYILVQRANRVDSVQLMEATRVVDFLWEDDRVVGVRIKNDAGEKTIRARIVVGADGRQSTVANAVNPVYEDSSPGYRAIYYQYVRNFASPTGNALDGPEFSFYDDQIAYIFPSDAAMTCVALSINLDDFKQVKKDHEAGFHAHLARHVGIARRVAESTRDSELFGMGPIPNYVRVPFGAGWALVGDAGLHLDPWSGYGMDFASKHATFLAEAIHEWFSGSAYEVDALDRYHRRRNEMSLSLYQTTVNLSRDLRQIFA